MCSCVQYRGVLFGLTSCAFCLVYQIMGQEGFLNREKGIERKFQVTFLIIEES